MNYKDRSRTIPRHLEIIVKLKTVPSYFWLDLKKECSLKFKTSHLELAVVQILPAADEVKSSWLWRNCICSEFNPKSLISNLTQILMFYLIVPTSRCLCRKIQVHWQTQLVTPGLYCSWESVSEDLLYISFVLFCFFNNKRAVLICNSSSISMLHNITPEQSGLKLWPFTEGGGNPIIQL